MQTRKEAHLPAESVRSCACCSQAERAWMTQVSRSTTRKEVRRLAASAYPAFASQAQHASPAIVSIVLARMQ